VMASGVCFALRNRSGKRESGEGALTATWCS
jgi:hypothetical protein